MKLKLFFARLFGHHYWIIEGDVEYHYVTTAWGNIYQLEERKL